MSASSTSGPVGPVVKGSFKVVIAGLKFTNETSHQFNIPGLTNSASSMA